MSISNIIAGLSLILNIYLIRSTLKNRKLQREQNDRENNLARINTDREERAARTERTADVSADLHKATDDKWKLRVFNKGPATATNVRLVLDADNQIITEKTARSKFPMNKIEKDQYVELGIYIDSSMKQKEWLRIQWDDAAQTGNENRIEITI